MVLNDLHLTRKEYSKKLSKKNNIENIFDKPNDIEYICEKNDTSLFAYTTDTKKKPMNLLMGSTFNYKLMDIFEFEVGSFIPISYFAKEIEVDSYIKPVIIFQGDLFETDFQYERIKKFFLDFFRIQDIEEVVISELRKIMIISAGDDKEIKIRNFQIEANMNEYNINEKLNFKEIGPSIDMKLRKIQLANEDVYKVSLRQPKIKDAARKKNIETNALGETRGRVHMTKQNLNTMALKKYKRILGKKKKIDNGFVEKKRR